MDDSIAAIVRRRASHACEYCHLPAKFHTGVFEIEHVIARQHGGTTTLGNLALACLRCNRSKGPNIAGIDRIKSISKVVPLFHPRRHKWTRHFRWDGPVLVGRTAIGRATVNVLDMNHPMRVMLREELTAEGLFPHTIVG
jgi:hypothetical protein